MGKHAPESRITIMRDSCPAERVLSLFPCRRKVPGMTGITTDTLCQLAGVNRGTFDSWLSRGDYIRPRQAAKTAKGARDRGVAQISRNRSAQLDSGDPMADYDLTWLWRELWGGRSAQMTSSRPRRK